jgi:uncharacterized protein
LNLYLDTSAILKLYLVEPGTTETRSLVKQYPEPAASLIAYVEVVSALAKSVRMKIIRQNRANQSLAAFQHDWSTFARVEVSEIVMNRAAALAWHQGLRGYDGIQLASALLWQETVGDDIALVTYDRELWVAARQEGLLVYPQTLA